jgi:hypothetical protein
MQSLNPDPQSSKQKRGKRKRVTQKQNILVDETPAKEEMHAIRAMRNNRGNRPKLDPKIEMFSETDAKIEEESDKDYDIQTTIKHESPSTSKKGVAVKKMKNKGVLVSENPRRNSTRVTKKYRLKSKAMFDPSIKDKNLIVIEDHSEDAEAGIGKKARRPPLHKKPTKRCKKIVSLPTRLVTRATTKLEQAKAIAKGISENPKNKKGNLVDLDHISDIPEAMDSASSDEEHISGLASKYKVKLREPKVAMDLNEPAPFEEFREFKVKVRTDKERIKELQKTVRQLKKEKALIEKWSARQKEKIEGFKKRKKEQRELLKELREIDFKLYWHNVVLTSKLK